MPDSALTGPQTTPAISGPVDAGTMAANSTTMNQRKTGIVVSIITIAMGVAWLLNTLHFLPGVDWVWTGALGVCGLLVIAAGGLNKLTFVVGPFLIVGSILSILRQTGRLRVDIEVPVLFIVFGILLLLAHLLPLRPPGFLQQDQAGGGK